MAKAVQIRTLDDIEQLLGWMGKEAQKPNLRFYRFVLQRLFDGGEFGAVHVDTLIKLISKNKLWNDLLNDEVSRTSDVLRDRFARRVRWLNKLVWDSDSSPYATTLAVVYDRSTSRYQMVTDTLQVLAIRESPRLRRQLGVMVEIPSEELHQGMPCLRIGGELEFSVRSSISGYIHIFHRDGDGYIDKLFPEYESEQSFKVSRGKSLFFPDAISDLCKLKCWELGEMETEAPVRQQVIVAVTGRNVDLAAEDLTEEFGDVRGRPVHIRHMDPDDLTARQKLVTIAEYQLKR